MSSRFAKNMLVVLIACVAAGAMQRTVPYAEFDMLARGFVLPQLALAAGAGLIGRWISRRRSGQPLSWSGSAMRSRGTAGWP